MERRLLEPSCSRAEALAAGLTKAELRDDGVRVSRGARVSRSVPLTVGTAAAALVPVLPRGAVFSHSTAAALLGAPVRHERPLHVTVPHGAYRPRRRQLTVHVRALLDDDLAMARGVPVTSGPQTWLDLAERLVEDELVAVGDALYRAGHLDVRTLARRLERGDGTRGIVRARRCAPVLTPASASRPESLVRWWVVDGDLPDPEVQVPVLDRRGASSRTATWGTAAGRCCSSTRAGSMPSGSSSAATSTAAR